MFLFGGAKKKQERPQGPTKSLGEDASDAIKGIRGNIELLEKRRRMLDVKLSEGEELVREKVRAKDRAGAKNALLKNNLVKKNAAQIENQILSLESQCLSLESTTTNLTAVNAMEAGLRTQKRIASAMNADKVDQLFEELAEQQELGNEVGELFAQNVASLTEGDGLEDELEQLEAQMMEQELLAAKSVPVVGAPAAATAAAAPEPARAAEERAGASAAGIPTVAASAGGGNGEPGGAKSREDAELEELQQQLGLLAA